MSAGLRFRNHFPRLENGRDRPAQEARQILRHCFQSLFAKSDAIDLHRPVGSDQVKGGHVGEAVVIGRGIAVVIEKSREGDAVLGAEVARVSSAVLRDGSKCSAIGAVSL